MNSEMMLNSAQAQAILDAVYREEEVERETLLREIERLKADVAFYKRRADYWSDQYNTLEQSK